MNKCDVCEKEIEAPKKVCQECLDDIGCNETEYFGIVRVLQAVEEEDTSQEDDRLCHVSMHIGNLAENASQLFESEEDVADYFFSSIDAYGHIGDFDRAKTFSLLAKRFGEAAGDEYIERLKNPE